jgi:NAD(P)-dependent dehydrogenase (short-subunit alcohol dehydrogenase family)
MGTALQTALHGKRVVLLGGTSGIGLATAHAASQEGASIVLVSSQQKKVDQAVRALPAGTEGHAVDLTNETAVRKLFDRVGAFDHLAFTAGGPLQLGTIESTTLEQARDAFELRYWGAYTAAKYASGHIRAGGSIVLTTGIAGDRPRKGWTVAASICTAITGLTRALAVELAPIRVNAVSAGVVRTDLWAPIPQAERDALYQGFAEAVPVGRVGEPGDIAQSFLYLMRDGFTTGTVLVVDGGSVLV